MHESNTIQSVFGRMKRKAVIVTTGNTYRV